MGNKGRHWKLSDKAKKNISIGHIGVNTWTKGKKLLEETKRKISKANKGKKRTLEQKKRMSKAQRGNPKYELRGSKHPFWKGGTTKLNSQIWHHYKYKQWRSDIFQRDNWTCQTCGKRGCYLESHHNPSVKNLLKLYNLKTMEEIENCKEFWNINLGVTLCVDCHNLTKIGVRKE